MAGKSVCTCGHLGDGPNSLHEDGYAPGHGACLVEGCSCDRFTWKGWTKETVDSFRKRGILVQSSKVPTRMSKDLAKAILRVSGALDILSDKEKRLWLTKGEVHNTPGGRKLFKAITTLMKLHGIDVTKQGLGIDPDPVPGGNQA